MLDSDVQIEAVTSNLKELTCLCVSCVFCGTGVGNGEFGETQTGP